VPTASHVDGRQRICSADNLHSRLFVQNRLATGAVLIGSFEILWSLGFKALGVGFQSPHISPLQLPMAIRQLPAFLLACPPKHEQSEHRQSAGRRPGTLRFHP
jgi:hypothetical protein